MNFRHFFIARGPGSPEVSGHSRRRTGVRPAATSKAGPAGASVVTVGQRLVLRGEQRRRLPLPQAALRVRRRGVHGGGRAGQRRRRRAAEHPHRQRVVRELGRA